MQTDKKFPEQDAPHKNTDDAFVKVGEDGSPVVPEEESQEQVDTKEQNTEADKATTLGAP